VVIGAVVLGDQVGILELVAFFAMGFLEADGEGGKALLAFFRKQADDQAESTPPDSSTPTGTSATMRRRTALRRPSRTMSRQSSALRARSSADFSNRLPPCHVGETAIRLEGPHRRCRQLAHAVQDGARARAPPRASSCSDAGRRGRSRCRYCRRPASAGREEAKARRPSASLK
jgi:hypothetical protein